MENNTTSPASSGSVSSPEGTSAEHGTAKSSSVNSSSSLSSAGGPPSSLLPVNSPPPRLLSVDEAHHECTDCGRLLPPTSFTFVKQNGKRFAYRQCNRCRAKRNAKAQFARRNHEYIEEQLAKPCKDCGKHIPHAMVFEYASGPRTINPSSAWRCMSFMNLQVEVSFCDVLCSNCQRIRRARLAEVPPEPGSVELSHGEVDSH